MTNPKLEEALDILSRAKDLLNTQGWIQGCYYVRGEGFCARGAIGEAGHPYWTAEKKPTAGEVVDEQPMRLAWSLVAAAINSRSLIEAYGVSHRIHGYWTHETLSREGNEANKITLMNDLPGQTKEGVLAVFDCAIENGRNG